MAFDDGTIDFRSDTVTRPTEEMRKAMAEASVGDDVYSDDPTANRFEEEVAEVLGFDAAVFVPSGTMANQLSIMVHTRPGDDVICDPLSHVRNIERGAAAAFSGVGFRAVESVAGAILPAHIDEVMVPAGRFFPRIRLACWENTHNLSGGRVVDTATMRAGFAAADAHGLAKHVDGARLFNAAIAVGADARELVDGADTVSVCMSKGLGAPVGSAVAGSADLVAELRYLRGRMGGGMRQSGVIAAAASIALRDRARLAEDHELARLLAERLADHDPGLVDPGLVETNILNVDARALGRPWEEVAASLAAAGILVNPPLGDRFRLVTHRDVDRRDVDALVGALIP